MTGSIQKKGTPNHEFLYINLSYKDPVTHIWKRKTISTKLPAKGNIRKAENMIPELIEKYSYLETWKSLENHLNPDISICDYLKIWLECKKSSIELSTYEGYCYRAKQITNYFEPRNIKLVDITPRTIDLFFKYLLLQGKVNQKTHERSSLSVRSVRSIKSILLAMFNQACIDGLISVNPVMMVHVQGKNNKDYNEEMLFLTEKECCELLAFLNRAEYPRYHRLLPIAFLAMYMGLRRSEILGLKWKAINFSENTITINHTLVRVGSIEAKDRTKTSSSLRTLSLFPTARKCFEMVKAEQTDYKIFFGNDYQNTDGYVFTWEDGRLYDPNYISHLFSEATATFGRPEISLHKLRHTCASLLINSGWDPKKLEYWLGHSDIQTTMNIYSHFDKTRLNNAPTDLENFSYPSQNLFN